MSESPAGQRLCLPICASAVPKVHPQRDLWIPKMFAQGFARCFSLWLQ